MATPASKTWCGRAGLGCQRASHTMSSENGVLHVIGVFNGKLSTIAHECAHMAFDICSRVGVDVESGRANETYCYLMSRLVEFCERHIKSRSDPA